MAKMYLSICLSDIPRGLIKEGSNGKKYINLNVGELRTPDDKGNDHYVSVYVPKAQRGDDDRPIFIGRGQLRTENSPRPARGNSPAENSHARSGGFDPNHDLPF